MKDDSIEISTKHLPLRIIGFVLAFVIAIGAFAFGVKKLSGNEAGYAAVTARADGDAPMYAVHFRLTYNFSGNSRAIRLLKNEISDAYSDALGHLYKLTDAENDYPGYEGNLADLNKRLNREVTLPRELFDILCDALERTERGEGYSIYAAPLYAEWESIAYSSDAEEFDPLINADERERLRAIADACADPDNRSLEIVDAENCVVRLNAAQSYLEFLEEYELPRTLLDLNVMRDAYLLRGVAAAMEQRGFADGFLSTTGGLTASLSGHTDGEYVIYNYVNNAAQFAASVPVIPSAASAAFTAFPVGEEAAGFYQISGLLRCAARPAVTGEDAAIRSVFVLRRDADIVAACYDAFACFLRSSLPGAVPDGVDLLTLTTSDGDGKTLMAGGSDVQLLSLRPGFSAVNTTSP